MGRSQILPYLTGLSELGHEIFLITLEKGREDDWKNLQQELKTQHNIDFNPCSFQHSPKGISFLINRKRFRKKFKELLAAEKFDLIHSRSIVPLQVCGALISKDMKVLFDMRGFWADERIDGGIWNYGNPLFKKAYDRFKRQEQYWISRSDRIVSLTHHQNSFSTGSPLCFFLPL